MIETEPVDDLIRDLGELRVAADAAGVYADQAIERAILEASCAVGAYLRQPDSPEGLSRAQDVLRRTGWLIADLSTERARSRRLSSTALGLRLKGQERRGR